MTRIERKTLILGERLGQGGQGSVYPVTNVKAGGRWDAVYKEYRPEIRDQVEVAALEEMVATIARLPENDRLWLGERASWPTDLVTDEGAVSGFLMRAVPSEFYFALRSLADPRTAKPRLAQIEFLLNTDDYVAGIGLTVSERDRMSLLGDLSTTLARLHSLGISVGDMSPKNLLFSLAPQPRCFLIDCDAMRVGDRSVLPQVETTEWELPEGEQLATARGDAYKFALLAARLFARDQAARDVARLTAAAPAVGELAHLTLQPDPATRPTLAAWAGPLGAAARLASSDPAQETMVLNPVPAPGPAFAPHWQTAPPKPPNGVRRLGLIVGGVAVAATLGITWIVNSTHSSASNDFGSSSIATDGSGANGGQSQNQGTDSGGQDSSPSPSPSDTTAEATQLQAFVSILSNTSSARSAVGNAVNGVGGCTEDPASGIATLQSSAQSRTSDAQSAQRLAVDAIPNGESLRSTLVSLLQDSATADNGYAQWMQDIQSQGCPVNTSSDQGYQSGDQASQSATQDKQNFVAMWNPLASQFGLTTYTADTL
jgi:hypothetical protein